MTETTLKNTMHIKGLAELGKFMQELPQKIERNVLRAALSAGAQVVKEAAKANCPVGETSSKNKRIYGGYAGALKKSIRVGSKINLRKGQVVAYVRAGGKSRKSTADTYYAHIIEYGAVGHRIGSKKYNNRLYIEKYGRWVQGPVNHPGMKGKPYMRPALDAESERAILVIANFIRNRLEQKHGLDTKSIAIGEEE